MRLRLRSLAVLAALVLASSRTKAQGGPPMVTDDPGTPGNRNWEINVAFATESIPGERVFETPLVDANYGLGERLQLKIEIPLLVKHVSGEGTESGLGSALLGVKYRFLDEDRAGVSLAVYPQVDFHVLHSSLERGLVEEGTGAILPMIAQKKIGPLSADVELGPVVRTGGKPRWFGGVVIGGNLSEEVDIAAEAFADTSAQFTDTDAAFNAGGRWRLGKHSVLLFSAGTGVHGSPDRPKAELLTYVGLQLLL